MIEKTVERLIFGSRWLMAPFYIGLIAVLAMLMIKFAQELLHFIPDVFSLKETDVILITLSLLDLTLGASLVLMMIFAGYENFVSRIDTGDDDRPSWMGSLDFGGLTHMAFVISGVLVALMDYVTERAKRLDKA
jgi:uncharacterized protein (TIGR00645 family)